MGYNGGNTQLLAKIVEKVSGQLIEQFVTENLFTPLGIKRYEWSKLFMKDTEPSAASGLRFNIQRYIKDWVTLHGWGVGRKSNS